MRKSVSVTSENSLSGSAPYGPQNETGKIKEGHCQSGDPQKEAFPGLCRLLAPGMPYLEPVENSPCSRRVCPPGRKSLNDKNCALRWRGHRLQTPASILAIRVPHRQKMHIFFDGYFSPYIRPAFP